MSPGPAKRKKEKYPGDKCFLCLVLGSMVVMVSSPPSPLHCHCHQSIHDPPHEQLLMRLGMGSVVWGCSVLPVPCPLSLFVVLCLLFLVVCHWLSFILGGCGLYCMASVAVVRIRLEHSKRNS
jgi:hypothetical protein